MIKVVLPLIIVVLLLLPVVLADNTLPVYVRPGTALQPITAFSYVFNFTSDSACANVLLSKNETITTDAYGVGFAELDISGITAAPSYLCEYRDGTLRAVHNVSDGLWGEMKATGNLTLGQKITFALGEMIDNIVDGVVRVTGNLYVGPDNPTFAFNDLDTYLGGGVEVRKGVISAAPQYGAGLISGTENFNVVAVHSTGDAQFDGTNKWICDYANNPFNVSYEKKFLTITSSAEYNHSTAVIDYFVNSSCLRVNFGVGLTTVLPDASGLNFTVYDYPVFSVFDQGIIRMKLGGTNLSQLHIYNPDGIGSYGVHVDDTCGEDNHQAMLVESNVQGCAGNINLNSLVYTTDNVTNQMTNNLLLGANLDNFSLGKYTALGVRTSDCGTVDCTAIQISPSFNQTIRIGEEDNLSKAWYDVGGSINDGTTAFNSPTTDVTLFTANNDYIYVGSTTNFTRISVSLITRASATIIPAFYYCDRTGVWKTLSGVLDSTTGFRFSGTIKFNNPSDRGVCNKEYDGTAFSDTTNYTYIAIKRTRASLTTRPVENLIDVGGSVAQMIMQKDMLMLSPISAPPATCSAIYEGAMYNDVDLHLPCYCTGSGWVQMDDFSTGCS